MDFASKFNIGEAVKLRGDILLDDNRDADIMYVTAICINGDGISYECGSKEKIGKAKANPPVVSNCKIYRENELMLVTKRACDLEYGDRYYYIDGCGCIEDTPYVFSISDNDRFRKGNVFVTLDDAVAECGRREIRQQLINLSGGYKFVPFKKNYCLMLSFSLHTATPKIIINMENFYYSPDNIYFESAGEAQNAIDTIGEENLLYHYFNVVPHDNQPDTCSKTSFENLVEI